MKLWIICGLYFRPRLYPFHLLRQFNHTVLLLTLLNNVPSKAILDYQNPSQNPNAPRSANPPTLPNLRIPAPFTLKTHPPTPNDKQATRNPVLSSAPKPEPSTKPSRNPSLNTTSTSLTPLAPSVSTPPTSPATTSPPQKRTMTKQRRIQNPHSAGGDEKTCPTP